MKITVETLVNAPITKVWSAYTTPADVKQCNAASDEWHTTQSTVDLCEGARSHHAWKPRMAASALTSPELTPRSCRNSSLRIPSAIALARFSFCRVQTLSRCAPGSTPKHKIRLNSSVMIGKPS
jgi:hypothetical protein